MRRCLLFFSSLSLALTLPVLIPAMLHAQPGLTTGTPVMERDSHQEMQSLGESVRQGVAARASIKAYDQETIQGMKVAGIAATHHLMVFFKSVANGMEITDGLVAFKVRDAAGQESKPLRLMPVANGFGADIILSATGAVELMIGCKLKDGKKRQFEFFYLRH